MVIRTLREVPKRTNSGLLGPVRTNNLPRVRSRDTDHEILFSDFSRDPQPNPQRTG